MKRLRHNNGIMMLDLMIGIVVITITLFGALRALSSINKGLAKNRFQTAMKAEVQQMLNTYRNRSYDQVPTSDGPTIRYIGPSQNGVSFYYDAINYPPQTVSVGGMKFTLYAYAQKISQTSRVSASSSDDVGLKQLTVTADGVFGGVETFSQGTLFFQNNETLPSNAQLIGTVKASNGSPLSAFIEVMEQPAFNATSNAGTGAYSIFLPAGTWTIQVSKADRASHTGQITIKALPDVNTMDFVLPAKTYGGASAFLYYADRPVISQVGKINGVSYIEIFNPLGNDINVSDLSLYFSSGPTSSFPLTINPNILVIPAQSYYLMTSGGAVNGKAQDAMIVETFIAPVSPGGLKLTWMGKSDQVGWTDDVANYTQYYEAPTGSSIKGKLVTGGLSDGVEITRIVSTGTYSRTFLPDDNNLYGASWDSDDNNYDFASFTSGNLVYPNNTTDGSAVIVTGRKSMTAYQGDSRSMLWCTDGTSMLDWVHPVGASSVTIQGIYQMSTGQTNCYYQVQTVPGEQYKVAAPLTPTIISGVSVCIASRTWPNSTPVVPALVANTRTTNLKTFFSLTVQDRNFESVFVGVPSTLPDRSNYTYTNEGAYIGKGNFATFLATGICPITINAGPNAVAEVGPSSTVVLNLPLAGMVYTYYSPTPCSAVGKVTSAGTNLKGVAMMAYDTVTGMVVVNGMTKSDGTYSLALVADRVYRIVASLQAGQSITSPISGEYVIDTRGAEMNHKFTGNDFDISANLSGSLTGTLKNAGKPISDGLLVMVSTYSLPGDSSPPPITSDMRKQSLVLYGGVADTNGQFTISVAPNAGYVVSSWYNGVKKEIGSVVVSANSNTTLNISWP